MPECLIVGGGIIGLSLAYELAGQGASVELIEQGDLGRKASWAGAGILPPVVRRPDDSLAEQLAGLSRQLHAVWAERLKRETGIDNGYRQTGAIHVARDDVAASRLLAEAAAWHERGVEHRTLSAIELRDLEPTLVHDEIQLALLTPGEGQLRNPRHLQALAEACRLRGVQIATGVEVQGFQIEGGEVRAVQTSAGPRAAEQFCLTSGVWSARLAASIGLDLAIEPLRGQIVLLNCRQPLLRRIVNDGKRYLVPRDDGRVLVGSTEEHAGFAEQTTSAAVADLLRFACGLAPPLEHAEVERCWAGLRPVSADGVPYLGRAPGIANLYVSAGHGRNGLLLSTGSAVVMSELIRGRQPQIDLTPFRLDRRK